MAEVDDAQRQERRKKAGDLLKMADKLFKGSDFEGAARLVNMAMETDPKNAYALAYQERVKYAIAQRDVQRLDSPKAATTGAAEGPAGGEQAQAPGAKRPSPEEIKKKVEQAQRKIAEGRAHGETEAPAKSPEPGAQQLQKELDEVVRTRDALQTQIGTLQTKNEELQAEVQRLLAENKKYYTDHQQSLADIQSLHGDLHTLQEQAAQSQSALEAERERWGSERDASRAQSEQLQAEERQRLEQKRVESEQRLAEERQRLEQKRVESEQRLEATARTLRTQLEEGVNSRAILQRQIQDLQGQLEKAYSATEEERQKWGAEHASVLDATRAEWEQRLEEERRRLEADGNAMRVQVQELEAARNSLENQIQDLRHQLELAQEVALQERQQWEAERIKESEDARAGWEQRLAEEHHRLEQMQQEAEQRLAEVTSALQRQLEEITLQHDTAQGRVQELEAKLAETEGGFEGERKNWLAERDNERASAEHEWGQRLAEEQTLRETMEAELQNQLAALTAEHETLVEQFQNLREQHEDVVARFAEEQAHWEADRQSLQEGMQADAERKLEEERRHFEDKHARRVEADLDAWESRLQEERHRWDDEHKEAERALQARHMAEMSAVKEQMQSLAQSRKQEESQSLQDLRRTLEQEAAQRFDTATKNFQEDRQRMELEMQSRLAAELHRQEDLRRERDELLTQLDGRRATLETERRRLEEEFQNRTLTERTNAAEEMRGRLEGRFEQERDALQRSTRAAVEAEMQERFAEERAALVREQQRLEDELRRLSDKRQLEAQEGEAARSQVEEFQQRLVEEQRVQEKRSQDALEAAQQRWKTDQERQVEEIRAKLIAEYEGKLEKEHQTALELRNRDHEEALETRRGIEEQLRKEFEASLMNRMKEERERFQSEYQDRMEGERARLELELRSAFDAEAQRRSDEDDRIAREDRKAHEEKERERRKEEEARKYEDAVRQAIDEGRHKAHLRKIASHMEQANDLLKKAKFAKALDEVSRIFTLDPSHEEGLALQHTIRAAQAEHDRRQEEVHRLQEEQKHRLEEMQSRLKEQEQKDRALQKERAAMEETVAQRIVRAAEYRRLGALDRALSEVQAVLTMDPGNGEAQDMEISILTQLKGHKEVRAAVARRTEQGEPWRRKEAQSEDEENVHRDHLREESALVYRSMLKQAWMQGVPGRDTRAMLDVARVSLGINENDHTALQSQVQLETYREALEMALGASLLEIDDVDAIDGIRSKYGVDTKAHEAVMLSLRRRTS